MLKIMNTQIKYFILISILITSCTNNPCREELQAYTKNTSVIFDNGLPRHFNTQYFPIDLFIDTFLINSEKFISTDKTSLLDLSNFLYDLKEPMLNNIFLNKEIYRLICLGAFGPDIILKLEKYNDQVYLTYEEGYPNEKDHKVIRNKELKPLTFWNDFKKLLENNKFYCMPEVLPFTSPPAPDSPIYILERHSSNGYKAIRRCDVNYDFIQFKTICNFLSKNCTSKFEI
jgi:hypothetical protein